MMADFVEAAQKADGKPRRARHGDGWMRQRPGDGIDRGKRGERKLEWPPVRLIRNERRGGRENGNPDKENDGGRV